MKNIVLLVIFVLGIVLMQYIQSHSVDDIINRYLAARGGRDKLNAIRSIYMEGTREIIGTKVPIKITQVHQKLFRTDFDLEGMKGYTVVTPTKGLSYIPIKSQHVEPIPDEHLSTMQLQLDIAGPLVNYHTKGYNAERQGKDFINARECFKIKLTLDSGREIIYYIDKETDLVLQSRQMSGTDGNHQPQEIITNYSDYKLFDGIMFPQTISNPAEGIMGGITRFDLINVNKVIDEEEYNIST